MYAEFYTRIRKSDGLPQGDDFLCPCRVIGVGPSLPPTHYSIIYFLECGSFLEVEITISLEITSLIFRTVGRKEQFFIRYTGRNARYGIVNKSDCPTVLMPILMVGRANITARGEGGPRRGAEASAR